MSPQFSSLYYLDICLKHFILEHLMYTMHSCLNQKARVSDFAPPQYSQIFSCTESMRVTELRNTCEGMHVSRLFLLTLQDSTILP